MNKPSPCNKTNALVFSKGLNVPYLNRFNSLGKKLDTQLTRKLTRIAFLALIALSTILTFRAFPRVHSGTIKFSELIFLLNLDLAVLLTLGALFLKRITRLWVQRKAGNPSAKLYTRFTVLFSLVAIIPAILMTVFSGFLFNLGLQQWFSERISTALKESTIVAEAYLVEHTNLVGANVENMAFDLARDFPVLFENKDKFNNVLNLNAQLRNLDEVLVFDAQMNIIAKSRLSFSLAFETFSENELKQATYGTFIKQSENAEHVRALRKISPHINAYLLVGRAVDPSITKRIQDVHNAQSDYREIQQNQTRIQLQFMLLFTAIALLILFAAVWVGLLMASRIARPIGALIDAAGRVQEGDYRTKVSPYGNDDEISSLVTAFNTMTSRISEQNTKLTDANQENKSRRRFIENILDNVSHGVISLTHCFKIQLINRSALDMLNLAPEVIGCSITSVSPELLGIVTHFQKHSRNTYSKELRIPRRGELRTLLVRLCPETTDTDDIRYGSILTISDVTDLLSAQRKAAWADVARRIAHEIRNPLTPIQLSAERLARKYKPQIQKDSEKFESCVETIIRQVEHIGFMVKEFSDFARMPEPKMSVENLIKLFQQHLDQHKTGQNNITFQLKQNDMTTPLPVLCDAGQISQVITNIFQNAIDALCESNTKDPLIQVCFKIEMDQVIVSVEDNGPGFPKENRDSLSEPYITQKEKGTGLGLAIVKKIIEDHGGCLILRDSGLGGAQIQFSLKRP